MKHILYPAVAVVAAFVTSCSNSVELSPSDQSLVSPTRVKNEVGLPEAIQYVDTGKISVSSPETGGDMMTNTLGERADRGAIILRDEFVKALSRSHVSTVSESTYSSELKLTITELGLIPVARGGDEMQFTIKVMATLSDLSGRTLWQSSSSSHPLNDPLPVRNIKDYKADNELVRRDFAIVSRHISDLLVNDLKQQMTGEDED